VRDIDMLTLDHINDDGAEKRKQKAHASGKRFYSQLRAANWPTGFQTLCANHQLKKYIAWCKEKHPSRWKKVLENNSTKDTIMASTS
jgi:hypothetical protein